MCKINDKEGVFPDNVPGRYCVTKICIGCTLCSAIAPENFTTNYVDDPEHIYDYVYKQPENPEEEEQCMEALDHCPVGAISSLGSPKDM